MKFSILLPTRNRLELLRLAVESVRQQDYADWEIVISDNASEEDIAGFVSSCADERIRYYRTQGVLPVTENWNAALEHSGGDYLIMLGDDDGLMRGCLASAHRLTEDWKCPDAIYAEALQFAYPGVIPGHEQGFVQTGFNAFMQNRNLPFQLARETALEMVQASLAFRIRYGFNMQHFIFSRRLVDSLRQRGPFFQSPYPDYYAANAILLAADSIVVHPQPLVMIGISPKSFGYYYYNRRENEGVEFLQNVASEEVRARLRGTMVPGTNMNDSWLCAMETLAQNFRELSGLRVDYRRYRLLQYFALLKAEGLRGIPGVLRHMRFWEMALYAPAIVLYGAAFLLPPNLRRKAQEALRASFSAFPRFDPRRETVPCSNILEAIRHHGQ